MTPSILGPTGPKRCTRAAYELEPFSTGCKEPTRRRKDTIKHHSTPPTLDMLVGLQRVHKGVCQTQRPRHHDHHLRRRCRRPVWTPAGIVRHAGREIGGRPIIPATIDMPRQVLSGEIAVRNITGYGTLVSPTHGTGRNCPTGRPDARTWSRNPPLWRRAK